MSLLMVSNHSATAAKESYSSFTIFNQKKKKKKTA